MAYKALPPRELLLQLLDYVPETGLLYWKARPVSMFSDGYRCAQGNCDNWNGRMAGTEAFTRIGRGGYRSGRINGVDYQSHRVIYVMIHGQEPLQVDHINGNPVDNRPSNLRSVTSSQNNRNRAMPGTNRSGRMGVMRMKGRDVWRSSIKVGGKTYVAGYFDDFQEACDARDDLEVRFGFHKNHGRSVKREPGAFKKAGL